jgi:hypothetical protein
MNENKKTAVEFESGTKMKSRSLEDRPYGIRDFNLRPKLTTSAWRTDSEL